MNIKQDEANTKGNRQKKWEFAGESREISPLRFPIYVWMVA
jgi:hypothetical protein